MEYLVCLVFVNYTLLEQKVSSPESMISQGSQWGEGPFPRRPGAE